MLDGAFVFEAATHRYRVGGVAVPGITTILRRGGASREGPWFRSEHRERGRMVHAACLVRDLGTPPQVPSQYGPFYDGWDGFMREVRPTWEQLEEPRVERALHFAGTPDREGWMRGWRVVVEIKTGRYARWHGYQLAGQDILLGGPRRRRFAVYLPGDGTYRVREFDDPGDYPRFLQMLEATDGEAGNEDDGWEQDD